MLVTPYLFGRRVLVRACLTLRFISRRAKNQAEGEGRPLTKEPLKKSEQEHAKEKWRSITSTRDRKLTVERKQ